MEDETSPTDSLVSTTGTVSEEVVICKERKHKINAELIEKEIDEISPELEMISPLSPGTPTHNTSRSLSLSDCGNLIDDEFADQPVLICSQNEGGKDHTDTPTLTETFGHTDAINNEHSEDAEHRLSQHDNKMKSTAPQLANLMVPHSNRARNALHQAMELSLRTPLSLRKALMERAESLDTLSPCESICSDDLMMDFDTQSSIDSVDR